MPVLKRYVIGLAVLALVLTACGKKTTAEEEVRRAVMDAAAAVEDKDVKGFMHFVSKDFSDSHGNGYDAVKGIIFFQTMRQGAIRVFVRGLTVEVEGDKALVNARAFVVRAAGEEGLPGVLPRDAEGLKMSVVMRLEDGRWKALSAEWDEVGALGLL